VIVMALAAMVVLLSILGLAIDGGRGYWERRQAQNAAEHAALAAAWESCHDTVEHGDWEDAARDAAADNGFTHNGTDVWVTPTNVSGLITVTVRSRLETTFSGLMGFETIDAEGRAVADCRSTSGNGFAIFAGGNNCKALGKFQVDISGQDNVITGAVHSNDNIRVGGPDNVFDGAVTYFSTEQHDGSTDFNVPYPKKEGSADWPVAFNLADYRALAEQSPTDNLYFTTSPVDWAYVMSKPVAQRDGLYYSTEKIDVSGSGPLTLNATFVSEKEVIIGGSDLTLNPYPGMNNLLAFAGHSHPMSDRCDKEGVKVSGGSNTWRGFIYAPESAIIMDGSSNSTLIGSLIGWAVKLSGSTLNNTADPSFFPGPAVLRLVE
jgi:hypothetical protein